MSVFSMSGDYSSDCRSIDGISSEIFVHSDLNEYRGALVGGTRCKELESFLIDRLTLKLKFWII